MNSQDLSEQLRNAQRQPRTARLFRNGRNQALRLPRELEFEGVDEVVIYQVGSRLVIEPKRRSFLELAELSAADDNFLEERPRLLSDEPRVKL